MFQSRNTEASERQDFMYKPLPTSMIRCTENVQPPVKRYEHCNNTRNLSLCIKGSTVQVSNYTDCSRIYTAQPLLRSHKNLLTKTASRSHLTRWQSVNKINRRITRRSPTQKISELAWTAEALGNTTWSCVQRSVMAWLERSEHLRALLEAPTFVTPT